MQYEEIKHFTTALAIIAASELEFGNFEKNPGVHVSRFQKYTKEILTNLQKPEYNGRYSLSETQINQIAYLSMFHDVGKCRIPWNIVHKPGTLTDKEFETMKLHTTYGADIILKYKDYIDDDEVCEYIYNICKYHHERADGGGYPCGLKMDEVPFYCYVVGIVDIYDVCISSRSYKNAMPKDFVLQMLREDKCGAFPQDIKEAAIYVFEKDQDNH